MMPMVLSMVPMFFVSQDNQKGVQHDFIGHVTSVAPALVQHHATGTSVSIM